MKEIFRELALLEHEPFKKVDAAFIQEMKEHLEIFEEVYRRQNEKV